MAEVKTNSIESLDKTRSPILHPTQNHSVDTLAVVRAPDASKHIGVTEDVPFGKIGLLDANTNYSLGHVLVRGSTTNKAQSALTNQGRGTANYYTGVLPTEQAVIDFSDAYRPGDVASKNNISVQLVNSGGANRQTVFPVANSDQFVASNDYESGRRDNIVVQLRPEIGNTGVVSTSTEGAFAIATPGIWMVWMSVNIASSIDGGTVNIRLLDDEGDSVIEARGDMLFADPLQTTAAYVYAKTSLAFKVVTSPVRWRLFASTTSEIDGTTPHRIDLSFTRVGPLAPTQNDIGAS